MSIKRSERTGAPSAPASTCVVVSGHPVSALRCELAERTVSFPPSIVKVWESIDGEAGEKLIIYTDKGRVTVTGRGLAAVHDALDAGRLQVIRESPGRRDVPDDEPWIQAIVVDFTKEKSD